MTTPHLLLIDGLNVLRRVYEAVPSEDSPEKAQGAMTSALGSFRRLLREIQPSHVLAAFDYGGPTWRHRLYGPYKEGRTPMPAPLKEALPEFYDKVTATGIRCVSIPDVEADDVLATAALRWQRDIGAPVTIGSSDKDLGQLLNAGIAVFHPFTGKFLDAEWSLKKFGVPPDLILDAMALIGDSTDGIPGAKGIGVKTAAKLLQQHGSLDKLLSVAFAVPGAVGDKLRAAMSDIAVSRELVRLWTDVKVGLSWKETRLAPDTQR